MSGAERGVRADFVGGGSPDSSSPDSAGAASGLRAASELRLLPCPFCGGDKITVELLPRTGRDVMAMVSCDNCGAIGSTTAGQSIGEAVYRWNTRQAGDVAAGASLAAEDVTFFLDL